MKEIAVFNRKIKSLFCVLFGLIFVFPCLAHTIPTNTVTSRDTYLYEFPRADAEVLAKLAVNSPINVLIIYPNSDYAYVHTDHQQGGFVLLNHLSDDVAVSRSKAAIRTKTAAPSLNQALAPVITEPTPSVQKQSIISSVPPASTSAYYSFFSFWHVIIGLLLLLIVLCYFWVNWYYERRSRWFK